MASDKTPLSQKFFVGVFALLSWLERWRTHRPFLAQLGVGFFTIVLTAFCYWLASGHPLPIDLSGTNFNGGFFTRSAISLLVGLIFHRLFLNGILPTLFYAKQSIAMRSMGMEEVFVDQNNYDKILNYYLKFHSADDTVKVLCISGHYLFQASTMPNGGKSPLHEWALNGKLEVIFPKSSQTNPTVAGRFSTYSEEFKVDAKLNSVDDLVNEIASGKRYLLSHSGNSVFEHDMLCMWRLVVLSNHCIVQNYFPNAGSTQSFMAPVLVFVKNDNRSENYYRTYSMMYDLVKESATRLTRN